MITTLSSILSYFCLTIGLIFWLWGTLPLIGHRSLLYKIHTLSVSDTLGSMSIIVGLLLRIPREWPLLILALISLAIWNTVLGYVMAYCSSPEEHAPSHPDPTAYGAAINVSGGALPPHYSPKVETPDYLSTGDSHG